MAIQRSWSQTSNTPKPDITKHKCRKGVSILAIFWPFQPIVLIMISQKNAWPQPQPLLMTKVSKPPFVARNDHPQTSQITKPDWERESVPPTSQFQRGAGWKTPNSNHSIFTRLLVSGHWSSASGSPQICVAMCNVKRTSLLPSQASQVFPANAFATAVAGRPPHKRQFFPIHQPSNISRAALNSFQMLQEPLQKSVLRWILRRSTCDVTSSFKGSQWITQQCLLARFAQPDCDLHAMKFQDTAPAVNSENIFSPLLR